jgi:hypothetical protein
VFKVGNILLPKDLNQIWNEVSIFLKLDNSTKFHLVCVQENLIDHFIQFISNLL